MRSANGTMDLAGVPIGVILGLCPSVCSGHLPTFETASLITRPGSLLFGPNCSTGYLIIIVWLTSVCVFFYLT